MMEGQLIQCKPMLFDISFGWINPEFLNPQTASLWPPFISVADQPKSSTHIEIPLQHWGQLDGSCCVVLGAANVPSLAADESI